MQRIELTLYHTPVPRAQRGVRDKLNKRLEVTEPD